MQHPSPSYATVDQVRAAVSGLIAIESYMLREDGTIVLEGTLLTDARASYRPLRQRIEALGFTPFLRRNAEGIQLVAVPGVLKRHLPRVTINVVLFVLTAASVLWTGAVNETGVLLPGPGELLRGLPFALTLLGILVAHEMGHFVVGRLRGAPVSWPYFIPLPVLSLIGTMGAVIVQREPLEDRQTLLEVGIAGPIAGLVVALPLLFLGLSSSPVTGGQPGPYIQEGNSLLYATAKWLVHGRWLPGNGLDVQLNAVAWAAWVGLLVTMFNLLPVGQLDGGHIAYALLGPRAQYLAYAVLGLCVVMGVVFSYTWLFWAFLGTMMGLRHPPPLNDVPTLGRGHTLLAISGLLLFVLLLMPAPLTTGMR
jgi:Zn-dependent protease